MFAGAPYPYWPVCGTPWEGPREDVAEVWLAVTEDGLGSSVNAGENAGRVLPHVATLRSLSKIGVAATNDASQSFTAAPA